MFDELVFNGTEPLSVSDEVEFYTDVSIKHFPKDNSYFYKIFFVDCTF